MKDDYNKALKLIEKKLFELRGKAKNRKFDHNKPAEIEINEFYFNGKVEDRIMVVLRASGCENYKTRYGCSMCAHYDGTSESPVSAEEYINQWRSVIDGSAIEIKTSSKFDINNFPVLCLYNLGSLLNPNEVPPEAVKEIFHSINQLPGIKKTIIESRAEYVTPEALGNIRSVSRGLVEVGIGLESSNYEIRELCHHKNMPDLEVFTKAINLLHAHNFLALAYVNQKPPFLTEKESIDDAIATSAFAFEKGVDAVSIEPTSLQANSLTDYLYNMGFYRVPWLWSVREVVNGIYQRLKSNWVDLRVGGYFDEEVLSGSQGVAPGVFRNELFPHKTAGNCNFCNESFIQAIKDFNKMYDLKKLLCIKECPYCYDVWESVIAVKDSRTIPDRIIDTLEA